MNVPAGIIIVTGQETESEFRSKLEDWLQYQTTNEEEARQTSAMLHTLAATESSNLIEILLEVMGKKDDDGGQYPYVSKLMTFNLSRDVLNALTQAADLDFYALLYSLAAVLDETTMSRIIANINTLFPDPEEIDLQAIAELLPRAIEADNYILTAYLDDLIAKLERGVVAVPEWIIPGWKSAAELEASVLPPKMLTEWHGTLEEDVEYILQLTEREHPGVNLADLRAQMLAQMQDDVPRRAMMVSLRNNRALIELEWDKETFRVFGGCLKPPNGVTLSDVSKDVCQTRGGCRVMTCYQHENWDPIMEAPIFQDPVDEPRALAALEWFTESCQNCHRVIRKKCYAVRMPIESGGWRGCYCSFLCLREQTETANNVRHRMINWFEELYYSYGIYDRD